MKQREYAAPLRVTAFEHNGKRNGAQERNACWHKDGIKPERELSYDSNPHAILTCARLDKEEIAGSEIGTGMCRLIVVRTGIHVECCKGFLHQRCVIAITPHSISRQFSACASAHAPETIHISLIYGGHRCAIVLFSFLCLLPL